MPKNGTSAPPLYLTPFPPRGQRGFASGRRAEPQDERYSFESCEEPAYVLPLQQE